VIPPRVCRLPSLNAAFLPLFLLTRQNCPNRYVSAQSRGGLHTRP
jgi:hypothetical protein